VPTGPSAQTSQVHFRHIVGQLCIHITHGQVDLQTRDFAGTDIQPTAQRAAAMAELLGHIHPGPPSDDVSILQLGEQLSAPTLQLIKARTVKITAHIQGAG